MQDTQAKNEVDVFVENHGTILLIRPVSDVAREWIDEHIGSQNGFQPYYPTVVCEPRYVFDVVAGMQASGLMVR